jgi:chromate reductase
LIGARRQPIGTSPGAIVTAVGQQHLRQILGILGSLVMGGEAYISFRPDLIDSDQNISNEGTREFLRQYISEFLSLVSILVPTAE